MSVYTIAEISRRLDLPESSVRYYRDRFAQYVPEYGQGRTRRYTEESLEVLRFIADMLRSGTPADAVEEALSARFPMVIDSQQQSAGQQQQSTAVVIKEMLGDAFGELLVKHSVQLQDAVRIVVEEQVSAAREETAQLRRELDERQAAIEQRLAERDRILTEALVALREHREVEQEQKRRSWWPFGR